MKAVIYSKRLSSIPAMLIFLGLNISFGISTVRHLQVNGTAQGAAWLIIGLIVFTISSTWGWRYCLNRRSVPWLLAYFTFQMILFTVLFWLENEDTKNGAGVGSLSVILLLQVCVMSWRGRLLVYGVTTVGMIVVSILYLPQERIIVPSITILFTSGAILLIGHIIVGEEQARDLLKETNQKLTEYATQVEALATANERNRLAREIHDNIGHYLTAVNMQIEAARAVMQTNPERAQESLVKAQTLTKEGLAEIRRSVAALRANPSDTRPLHEAIELLVEEHATSGLDVRYRVEGSVRPVSAQVEMALFRIAQEGLTNIRKHASATQADLELSYPDEQHVRLKVQDDGRGSTQPDGGFGLVGIRERVKLLGGRLELDTAQGKGFRLQVELPT